MRLTIFSKLFLSLFTTSLLMVIGILLFTNYSFNKGFQSYINQTELQNLSKLTKPIAEFYDDKTGWTPLTSDLQHWKKLFTNIGEPLPPRPIISLDIKRNFKYSKEDGIRPPSYRAFVLDVNDKWVIGTLPPTNDPTSNIARIPIIKNTKIIGWLAIEQTSYLVGPLAGSFYNQQKQNLYLIIGLASIFSLICAVFLVRHFLAPLKQLHQGALTLAKGDFNTQIATKGKDEIAELGNAFNSLSISLKQQKSTREQWITDISHELRTPIAVLRSEIEAIQDGIRTPEPKNIDSMHQQVLNLGKLVEDLYVLSKSEANIYNMQLKPISLNKLVNSVMYNFEARAQAKGLTLKSNNLMLNEVTLFLDEDLIRQLLVNVFENSIRYTDNPGMIKVSIKNKKETIELWIEDSSPSVPLTALDKLFGRLYRVDQSRSRDSGGSGLGLSICKNIIEQHNGSISAQISSLGGVAMIVSFKKQYNEGH